MTNSEQLAEKIHNHLKSGGAVRFATSMRVVLATAKHANCIKGSQRVEPINGVFVQRGRKWDYWMERYISFSK